MLVVGSRLHWNNHARDQPIDAEKALKQVLSFCTHAATYGDAIVLALGVPPSTSISGNDDPFARSAHDFLHQLPGEIDSLSLFQRHGKPCVVRLVPLTFWGQFVPALNAILSTAATNFPAATHILFQSLEVEVTGSSVDFMQSRFADGSDLVLGAALPGHGFAPEKPQPLVLDGLTSPWNTLALWDLQQLAKIGFPLVGDGLGIDGGGATSAAGVEEVSTIALYQQLYPEKSSAKLIQVPGLAWHVQTFDDDERRKWQQRKMDSKRARPAKQLAHLQLTHVAQVYHLM